MTERRVPPANVDAENSIIGSIMLWPDLMHDLVGTLVPDDFYQPRAQQVYDAMCNLRDAGTPIDIVTVSAAVPDIDREWLLQVQNDTPARSATKYYANLVIEAARRRELIALSSEVQRQAYDPHTDLEAVIADADPKLNQRIRPRSTAIKGFAQVDEWEVEAQEEEDKLPWLVPHILKPKWRVMVVAGEGVGKMVFLRQIGLHAAAGLDPFDPTKRIPPIRVLVVDCENSRSTILHHHRIVNAGVDLVKMSSGNLFLLHREQGFNLRERVIRAEFEAVIQACRPQLVIMGPLYRLGVKRSQGKNEDLEGIAGDWTDIVDDLRIRYGFAVMVEHHMPKQERGAPTTMEPFGSSLWKRWVETGIGLNDHGAAKEDPHAQRPLDVDIDHWRPPRDIAEWPARLEARHPGQRLAWVPTFEQSRGRRIGARWVDGEWTYAAPVKPGEQSPSNHRVQV